jgi:uncharacterized integral membrane protein (TIGR00697 family)
MINEIVFLLQSIIMGIFALVSLRLGKTGLTCFVTITCILANLFVVKQIVLCGYTATASDAYSIGAVLGLNLLQEYYDRGAAQKAIIISFILLIFYCVVSQLHLAYDPCIADTAHAHYLAILGWMPRIVAASLSVYITVQYIDAWFYGFLKKLTTSRRLFRLRLSGPSGSASYDGLRYGGQEGNYLVVRNVLSLVVCQLLDTVLFSFLGLYGILDNITEIIIVSYSVKLAAIGISIPFIMLSKKIMPQTKSPDPI